MIASWKSFLLQRSREWGLPGGEDWHYLLHNNYQPHYSNMNLIWFYGRERSPRLITKVFREPRIVKREFENLCYVHGKIPHLVPQPLYFGVTEQFWTLWMRGVPGSRFRASDACSPAVLRSLSDTVTSMHLAMRKARSACSADRYERVMAQPLLGLASFGEAQAVRESCRSLLTQIPDRWIDGLPVIPQHGDLFLGNLLSDRGRWYVLDWETYGITDLPIYDLVTLVISVLLTQGTAAEHWPVATTKQVRNLIDTYSRQFGLSRQDIGFLLPLSLANWFHLQWEDGRKEFTERMYRVIDQYFSHKQAWEQAILYV